MSAFDISISVAMASYNGEEYISNQLQSLSAQTLHPTELVIVDDGSKDGTIAIIDDFAKTAPFPIRIHQNISRRGYRESFMRAANLCQSRLIAFCDQDDRWYPQKLEVATRPFVDANVLLTHHNADVVSKSGDVLGMLVSNASKADYARGPWQYAPGFTEVFRSSLLHFSDWWPMSHECFESDQLASHDRWFYFLAAVFGEIIYIDDRLVAYIQHGTNTFGWAAQPFWMSARGFRSRAEELSRLSLAAESRAIVLENARPTLENSWRDRAAVAARRYRNLSRLYNTRHTLHTAASLSDRLAAFRSLIARNGYDAKWGCGYRALIVDIFLGVPFWPRMQSKFRK